MGGLEGEGIGGGRLKRVRVSGRKRKEDEGVALSVWWEEQGGSVDFSRVIVNSGGFYPSQYDVVRCFAMHRVFFLGGPKLMG